MQEEQSQLGGDAAERLECFAHLVPQLGAHALRASVVGVVVARRQRERSDHDAALHFGAEAFTARVEVDLAQRARALAAMSIADSVEAGEVRHSIALLSKAALSSSPKIPGAEVEVAK